jgi:hypothetical protein
MDYIWSFIAMAGLVPVAGASLVGALRLTLHPSPEQQPEEEEER